MKVLTAENTRQMLIYVGNKIIESKPYLTEVDSAIGDGDHGIGMALGMEKAIEKLQAAEGNNDVYKLFYDMGMTMLMSMGGASGVIFGMMFSAGGKGMAAAPEVGTKEFAEILSKGLAEVKRRGGAQVGDKTMIDAFEPAVIAMEGYTGDDFLELLALGEEAALKGVESTKDCIAKFGRAKSLGERAIGHIDAGAASTHIIVRSMQEYCKTL